MKKLILTMLISILSLTVFGGDIETKVEYDPYKGVYTYTSYYADGNIMAVKYYNSEEERVGTWKGWYENGNLAFIQNYADDMREGSWIVYRESGDILHTLEFHNGKRVGTWKSYNEDGELAVVRFYNDGKLFEQIYASTD